jgi:NADPH-dependent 2,4-dienoyl-CoA reductase/sulfur reductase-like enzyme
MSTKPERALVPAAQQKVSQLSMDRADIVIVGNGIAGLTAAVEARRHAPDKRIVMITDQIHPTINTPALKQFAIAKLTREQLLAYPAGTERSERIHIVNARVEEIHAQSKYVTLTGKRGFGYESLLIATGSAPMGLPENTPGRNFDGVMMLHRLQDYLDFRRRLAEVTECVVVGGGVHAIETVMGVAYWGIKVHWLIRGETFMGKMLDAVSSEMVLERVRKAGVQVHTKTEVAGVVGRVGSVAGVITNHQEMLPCQMLLTCTGTRPVMSLADTCSIPLRRKKGIIVDDQLRTSVPNIFAAGDVAALKNPLTGEYEPRAIWYAAVNQARIVGAMLAGKEDQEIQPFGVPWHATHLGELSMLTAGDPLLEDNKVETLTDISQGGYRRMTIIGNRLLGYLSLGSEPPDSLAIKKIIDEGLPIRNVIKPLLKGKLDARQYVSEQRSRLAQGIITGQLSANELPQPQMLPVNAQLTPMPSSDPDALLALARAAQQEQPIYEEISSFSGQLPSIKQPEPSYEQEDPITEEVSPFTGNLPVIARRSTEGLRQPTDRRPAEGLRQPTDRRANEGLRQPAERRPNEGLRQSTERRPAARVQEGSASFLIDQPSEQDPFVEEVSPFTGNLPTIAARQRTDTSASSGNQPPVRRKAADPTLMPVASEDWQPEKIRGLWAYDEKPKDNGRRSQERVRDDQRSQERVRDDQSALPRRRSSRSLWSYSEQDQATGVEKGR